MVETTVIVMISIPIFLFGMLIGLMIGQCNIWRYLRKKGQVTIDDWEYTARRV